MSSRRSRKTPQLNYNHLHYFHVAAVEGSVGAAAQHLGVTQPTISEQLRTLEHALGVTLFDRQPTGLKLTEAGRVTFRHTSVMFNAGARLAEELDHGARQHPHLLRVGVCGLISRLATPSMLTPMLDLEGCVPSVRLADHIELLRELRAGTLDLAITDSEPPKTERRGLEVALLQRTQLSVLTRAGFEPAPDWRNALFLQYRVGSPLRWDVDMYLAARGVTPTVAAEADDAWLLVDAVGHGSHIAILPHVLVSDAIASGRLRELDRFESAHVGLVAIHRSGVELARKCAESLIEHYRIATT